MKHEDLNNRKVKLTQYTPIVGSILVISGLLLLLDQRLQTHWLSISIPVFVGVALTIFGVTKRQGWWMIAGIILFSLGAALLILLIPSERWLFTNRVRYALLIQGASWTSIFIVLLARNKKPAWWFLFPATIFFALAYQFLANRHSLLDYVLLISLAVGFVLLAWGICSKKIGLIIPATLIITIGAGLYYGWGTPETPGGLQKTGVMLVWFALGWILITVVSRVIEKSFIWWPLIPGGILLMVGSGLYIGGNPANALGFLGNTGSIGLILVGIYLIFLKYGINK